ncbi:MAG: DUF4912 domain-containing protein [Spirochaetia bacterium]|nr:DUF4912 domain-containing protein [Spirochaetia bacterium]
MKEDHPEIEVGIYHEPQINSLSGYYGRDIIKVLSKNPKEVFVFWGISEDSFTKIKSHFNLNLEEIHYKLLVRYSTEDKLKNVIEIYLPPFTTSYIIKFEYPVKNLRVEIIATNSSGSVYTLMQSAHINMPINKPSQYVHQDWIHPEWVREGYIEKEKENFIIKSFINNPIRERIIPEVEFLPIWESTIVFDGSSGMSSHVIPSSIQKRKGEGYEL